MKSINNKKYKLKNNKLLNNKNASRYNNLKIINHLI